MVKLSIEKLAIKRGYKNAHKLQLALGVSPTLASNLWKGTMRRVDLNTLDKLCKLLRVSPGKLFEYDDELP
jgi:DNA-binding Xre family transcriptional regulator